MSGAQQPDRQFGVFILRIDPQALHRAHFLQRSGERPEAKLWTLADTLSTSPLWAEMPRASLIVRTAPEPLLGVVGYFDAADKARLEVLRWQLEHVLPTVRYVGYDQAQEDCERLAARLVERFGHSELRGFRFVAIPRGGLIVLGMLAYILGLRSSQLESLHSSDAPLVVVDDCSLTGVRFKQFLEDPESSQVVFAHLYSSPKLREAIELRELGRVTCLSAHDLHDYAPENLGEDYSGWEQRWMKRMKGRGYWVGQLQRVCFAWNEPDFTFWNPITDREELGWRLLPPELCLKNRQSLNSGFITVQTQPPGKGPLRPSSRVLFGEFEGNVVVGDSETRASYALDGVGADMWQAIVKYGNLEEAANDLAKGYEVDSTTLRADLQKLVNDLLSQGLLKNGG